MLRAPAVAGQFYPDRPGVLGRALDRLIPQVARKRVAIGVISPHAGYVYSGGVAGKSFASLQIPPEVVILGPNHHGVGRPVAVYHRGGWQTPLGTVPIAETLADAILAACPWPPPMWSPIVPSIRWKCRCLFCRGSPTGWQSCRSASAGCRSSSCWPSVTAWLWPCPD